MDELILGLLDEPGAHAAPDLVGLLRGWTVDASRFGYAGTILAAPDFPDLLARAEVSGRRFCFVQVPGHVLAEEWRPGDADGPSGLAALVAWQRDAGRMAAGRPADDGRPDGGAWLVDLARWRQQGRPDLRRLDLPAFPETFARAAVDLRPRGADEAAELAALAGAGLAAFDEAASRLDASSRRYFARMRGLVTRLPDGVFVWNIEGYADIEHRPDGFRGPLSTLFSVAAGFKPNRLLETHGFGAATRLVFFDYSAPGLEFRRLLLDWDGRDYPDFLRRLFARLPPERAHYCLWEGQTPDNLDWQSVDARWRRELEAWGGADSLASHWRRYRLLPHHFVQVDLLGDRADLHGLLGDEKAAAIWWSNAFFSMVSNWYFPASARRSLFRDFLAELAAAAPRLWLYGASSDNQAVNAVQAAEAARFFAENAGDELSPATLQRVGLRF